MTTPGSPLGRESRDAAGTTIAERLNDFLKDISDRFGLVIKARKDGESPDKRHQKLARASKAEKLSDECYFKIRFLLQKETKALKSAYEQFQSQQSGWVHKPNADHDALPRNIGAQAQVEQKFECFLQCIRPVYDLVKQQEIETRPLKEKRSFNGVTLSAITPQPASHIRPVDDTPIPFCLDPKGKGKRQSDGNIEINDNCKRTRLPRGESNPQMIIDAIDGVPVTNRPQEMERTSRTISAFQAIALDDSTLGNTRTVRDRLALPSANTSFNSNAPAVFDYDSDASDATFYSTQESVPDLAHADYSVKESEYGSSFNETDLEHEIKIPAVDLFRQRLQNVFPDLPRSLRNAPLAVRYEIIRICTFAKIDVMGLQFSKLDFSKLDFSVWSYEAFWAWLKDVELLKGKEFPEKSDGKAWEASLGTFHHGNRGVVLSAKMLFSDVPDGPFFKVQLQPLKLECSQRLGRRFGPDRFLELLLPDLTGRRFPKLFNDVKQAERVDLCFKAIVEWLITGEHNFLGITWGLFFVKDSAREIKKSKFQMTMEDNSVKFCAYLFATKGIAFRKAKGIPQKGEPPRAHTEMSVTALLNWLIPLGQNQHQKVMKLFSRIGLGLSRTRATVEVQPNEFRYLQDVMSADMKEVMNDGCGRLSLRMAKDVARCLDLTTVPSAFQARIGGAKGLWVVDFDNYSDERWIEIYPSQRKWSRNELVELPGNDDSDHRVFEVIEWSQPLRQAKLTLQFLQILEDRARDKIAFRQTISGLLATGLTREIESQRAAMDSPEGFRQWVRSNSKLGIRDRIKSGKVQYLGGFPNAVEEQINVLIDAGFHPLKQTFLKNRAWKVYSDTCELLKQKLKVTIGLSTYALMAVDFTGTLEPNEVYLAFSNTFEDEVSGFSECMLDEIDILVARSPAHYLSDIQKVKAVWKRELKSFKDVIVFSSKGNYPLAKKLSGGDYDGDKAWICWEPSIVGQFVNAELPQCPNLIELGYIQQEKTTYAELASENIDPVPAFLQLAFEFNLHATMLGMCTNFKDDVCYTLNSVNNHEAVYLSTLLSDLVDQPKQGYIFNSSSWQNFKSVEIKTKTKKPAYKGNTPPACFEASTSHIIDDLKFRVAEQMIESTKKRLHESLGDSQPWDDDLVRMALWARNRSHVDPDWKQIVNHIDREIDVIYSQWISEYGKANRENPVESLVDFRPLVTKLHAKWVAIVPPQGNSHSETLSQGYLPSHGAEYSMFALLKASLGFQNHYRSSFIWWMTGRQLAFLKANNRSITPGFTPGPLVVVVPHIYSMLKPDNTLINLRRNQNNAPSWLEELLGDIGEEEEEEEEDG